MKYFNHLQKRRAIIALAALMLFCIFPVKGDDADMEWGAIELLGKGFSETTFRNSHATMSYGLAGIYFSLLTLNIDYSLERYSWKKTESLPFGNGQDAPWKRFHNISLEGAYGDDINKKWSYFVLAEGDTTFEEHADFSFWNVSGGAAVGYQPSIPWQLILGGGGTYDAKDDTSTPFPVAGFRWNQDVESGWSASVIFPIELSLNYQKAGHTFFAAGDIGEQAVELGYESPHERFLFVVMGNVDTPLAKAKMTYRFFSWLRATAGYASTGTEYRLANDNPVLPAEEEQGYLRTEGESVELLLDFLFFERFNLSVGPYYAFSQELSIRGKHDKALHTVEMDDTFGGKCSLSILF